MAGLEDEKYPLEELWRTSPTLQRATAFVERTALGRAADLCLPEGPNRAFKATDFW